MPQAQPSRAPTPPPPKKARNKPAPSSTNYEADRISTRDAVTRVLKSKRFNDHLDEKMEKYFNTHYLSVHPTTDEVIDKVKTLKDGTAAALKKLRLKCEENGKK